MNHTMVACVCFSRELRFHPIQFDLSPYQLCKYHNSLPLDLCCHGDNRDELMRCLDDYKVELGCLDGVMDTHTLASFT